MAILGNSRRMYDITFLERGSVAAKAVSRLAIHSESGTSYCTGFLISEDWVLTTHHGLSLRASEPSRLIRGVTALFDYVWSMDGVALAGIERKGNIASIVADPRDDWAVIQLERPMPKKFPFLALKLKKEVQIGDLVFIVQHPQGEPKKVALARDPVSYVDDKVVQYKTDTQPGSSGAPVFNEAWEVVAMHHSGGWLTRPSAGEVLYINQGIRIERIVAGLRLKGVHFEKHLERGGSVARAYISAHAKDFQFVEELEKHLAPLKNAGKILVWHWGKATPGSTPSDDAARELRAADLVLIVASPDYLNSAEHLEEAKIAIERSKHEDVRVVPILARPSSWEYASFGKLQPLPQDRLALVRQPSIDQAYVDIAKAIGAILCDNDF